MLAVAAAAAALLHPIVLRQGKRRLADDAGIAVDPAPLRSPWLKTITGVVTEATLALPNNDWMQQGGRSGRHSEHLGHLLSELQSLQRSFPGALW